MSRGWSVAAIVMCVFALFLAQWDGLDWNAVGAVGSGGAAIGSLVVAVLTRDMARSAQISADAARQESATLWRPLLVPVRLDLPPNVIATTDRVLRIQNVGQGPALGPSATISDASVTTEGWGLALPPGEGLQLSLRRPPASVEATDISVTYEDIAGLPHELVAKVRWSPSGGGPPRVEKVDVL